MASLELCKLSWIQRQVQFGYLHLAASKVISRWNYTITWRKHIKHKRGGYCSNQSYKYRTDYYTVFSLQPDMSDLCIVIPDLYRFEFQKRKILKCKDLKFYLNLCILGGIWSKIPIRRYRLIFADTERHRPIFNRYKLGH